MLMLHSAPNKMASSYGVTHSAAWCCSTQACLRFHPNSMQVNAAPECLGLTMPLFSILNSNLFQY